MEASNRIGIIPHVTLQKNNDELHFRMSQEPKPFQGQCWQQVLPDFIGEKTLSLIMKWEDEKGSFGEFCFKNMNIENEDYNKRIKLSDTLSKQEMERFKLRNSFEISFRCLNSGKSGGIYDVHVNDLSSELLETQENLVDTPPRACENQSLDLQDTGSEVLSENSSDEEDTDSRLGHDVQHTFHFPTMLDLAENNSPEVSSENSSDEDTDSSLVDCPFPL